MDRYLLLAQLAIPEHLEQDFNRLYDEEHIPPLLKLPGVLSASRFRLYESDVEGMPEYLAVYELTDPSLPHSKEWRSHADGGEWSTVVRPHLKARWHSIFRKL